MKKTLFAMAAGIALAAGPAFAQAPADKPKTDKTDKAAPAAGEMPQAKPGPEHEILKKSVGTWDATVEEMAPGAPPKTSKGTETAKLVGGLWLVSDFKSEMMGQPFEGHAVGGYDPSKKKYVGTWVDSMSASQWTSEGTLDPATKTMTDWMEGVGHDGKPTKMKAVTQWKDDDTRVFTMYMGETPTMKITYKRRK
jgi:hypothetical protein